MHEFAFFIFKLLFHIIVKPINLLKKERQVHIIHQINLHNRVLVSDLCANMRVSEDTIRRDLNELAALGRVVKIHGGALSISFQSSLQYTNVYSKEEKHLPLIRYLNTSNRKCLSLLQVAQPSLNSQGYFPRLLRLHSSLPVCRQ